MTVAEKLVGREAESIALDGLLDQARAGRGSVLVVRGEAGVGKSSLLDYVARHAADARVVHATGVEAEVELPLAALKQLLDGPLLAGADELAPPQRAALDVAFGLREGPAPDRFLVALAVLGLVTQAADAQPLVCLIDDAQWLDRTSLQVLAFVARRLAAEPVAMVFAVRESAPELDGLPELVVGGLSAYTARSLLDSVVVGTLDAQVRERIVAETRGNPLALLELPRALTPAELAGGFALPGAGGLVGQVEASFARRIQALPAGAQLVLLAAAAEPTGDAVRYAAERTSG